MKKTALILLALVALTSASAQQSLNEYKYIIVPNKFEFLKEADEFRLNALTKYLFEKANFEALMEDETLPSDYGKNNCLGLKADVLKKSTMFKTKLLVQLKNCKNEVIFTSSLGESREKNYKVAYNQALRKAFNSIENANYSYNTNNAMTTSNEVEVVEERKEEIEKLKEEIKVLKETKKEIIIEEKPEAVLIKEIEKPKVVDKPNQKDNFRLRAVAIPESGFAYNLLNSEGDKMYTILFSGKENLYIVKDKDAVIYRLNEKWVIAEAKGNDLRVIALDIKF